jgi:hypothetical protein
MLVRWDIVRGRLIVSQRGKFLLPNLFLIAIEKRLDKVLLCDLGMEPTATVEQTSLKNECIEIDADGARVEFENILNHALSDVASVSAKEAIQRNQGWEDYFPYAFSGRWLISSVSSKMEA